MLFIISRTSSSESEKPIPEAFIYKLKNGMKVWMTEFRNLNELISFIDKNGEVIMDSPWDKVEHPRIEIYDDYRE